MRYGLIILIGVGLASCGNHTPSPYPGATTCPIGATCEAVCPKWAAAQPPGTRTYVGAYYCDNSGALYMLFDRYGQFAEFAPGTYSKGDVGAQCDFTVAPGCSLTEN